MAVHCRVMMTLLLLRLTTATQTNAQLSAIRRETTQVSLSASGEVSRDITAIAEAALCTDGGIRKTSGTEMDVCCAASCGSCGDSGCGDRPGGAYQCCVGRIREKGEVCTSPSHEGCVIPHSKAADIDDKIMETEAADIDDKIMETEFAHEVGLTSDYCSFDFPLGVDNTDSCSISAVDLDTVTETTAIDSFKDCTEAARQAGVNVTNDFLIEYDHYDKHPTGCFTVPCLAKTLATTGNQNSHGQCYYYNPTPEKTNSSSDGFAGQPVCKRPRVKQGTENTNGADSCEDGYEPIKDEAECLNMQECLGKCRGGHLAYAQFRIDIENTTLFNSHPKWCFIRKEDNCVYFNEPFGSMTDPTDPVGWPLCNVTTTTKWSAPRT